MGRNVLPATSDLALSKCISALLATASLVSGIVEISCREHITYRLYWELLINVNLCCACLTLCPLETWGKNPCLLYTKKPQTSKEMTVFFKHQINDEQNSRTLLEEPGRGECGSVQSKTQAGVISVKCSCFIAM